ncbi:MAG TPA: Ig-like domain-containing protein [Candidatus Saccharimonadia bacterium]|nr:Ig-like domain-containing protein [Candidatus Saccharimonadia bacterium]
MPSRISRYEQRAALKQSIFFLALSGVLLVVFFVFVLPYSIRIYESIVQKKGLPQLADAIPPQKPVLNSLPDATNSAQLVISGYAEGDTKVDLFQNGSKIEESDTDTQGIFSFANVPFQTGENVFYVVSTDKANNSSESDKVTVAYDTTPPALTVTQPTDGSVVNLARQQLATVAGTSEANVKIYLNDKLLFTDTTGNFSGTYQLQQGDNNLIVRAVDPAGNETDKAIKVTYSP